MRDYRIALWENYSWSIAYYFSLKLHKNWDDVYSNLESNPRYWIEHYNAAEVSNASWEENASKYLRTQYNPLIIENMPPMLVKFSVRVEGGKLHYHILLRDAGRIESVLINDETGTGYYVNNSVNAVVFEHWGTFNMSVSEQVFTVRIRVVAYDTATNKLDVSRDVHGPVGAIINCALRFLSSLFQALAAAADRIVEGLNVIKDWLIDFVKTTISKFLAPIENMMNEWMQNILAVLGEFLISIQSTGMHNIYFDISGNSTNNTAGGNDAHNDTLRDLAIRFAKAFFSPQMWTLAMSLSIAVVSLATTINIFLKAGTGGGDIILHPLIKAISGTLIRYTIIAGLTEAALGGIFTIITFFIPYNNPIWQSGIFMDVINFIQLGINYAINHALVSALPFYLKMPRLTWLDAFGLSIGIIALLLDGGIISGIIKSFLEGYGISEKWSNLILCIFATVLSAISFVLTLMKDDFIDMFMEGALSYIEEIITGIATVYSSVLLGEALAEILRG